MEQTGKVMKGKDTKDRKGMKNRNGRRKRNERVTGKKELRKEEREKEEAVKWYKKEKGCDKGRAVR